MYNYRINIIEDCKEAIKERYNNSAEFCKAWEDDIAGLYNNLYDDLWVDDSVTGNASGSYWFNSWKAGEALQGNWDLLRDALAEFGCEDVNPIDKGEEWCDVTIRCYLLGECLSDAIAELINEYEEGADND